MKTNNRKILQLINHGFSGNLLSDLNEGQINALHSRLSEQVTTKIEQTKTTTVPQNIAKTTGADIGDVNVKTDANGNVIATEIGEDATLNVVNDPDASVDGMGMFEDKELQEKFESKKQQKYFFAKCGDGKTKEQKKWCKMADEFAEKTNFKKLPEKKKETKETFDMGDYYKKVASTAAGLTKKNLNQISPSVGSMGESELEKKIMRLVEKHITPKMTKKDFLSLVSEQGTKEKERTKEKEKTKEKERGTPYSPKPGPAKAPKAHKHEVDEQDVAPSKPRIKEPVTKPNKPGTPYSPKPGPAKAPKASKGELPSWLSFKSIGIKLK
jgi:hypothetical protein